MKSRLMKLALEGDRGAERELYKILRREHAKIDRVIGLCNKCPLFYSGAALGDVALCLKLGEPLFLSDLITYYEPYFKPPHNCPLRTEPITIGVEPETSQGDRYGRPEHPDCDPSKVK